MSKINSNDMFDEFLIEAEDLFNDAEDALLEIEKHIDFNSYYDVLFRCFQSLKDAAGMFGIEKLQKHLHEVESILIECKDYKEVESSIVDFFLDAIDASKKILSNEEVEFDYSILKNEKTIFVVDDDEQVLAMKKSILMLNNFDVKVFTSPIKLLQELKSSHPDAIISDIEMPEMNGVDLLFEINAIYPLLPVIVFSGYVTKDLCINVLSSGVAGIIEKPMNEELLINQLEHVISKYRAIKIMNKSIDLIVYQFNDFEKYLESQGKTDQKKLLRSEL